MSCLKCLLLFLPVYLKKSLDVFPGSTHCLWCLSGLSSVSVNVFQLMSFQSVSQCLFSNLSTGATWCLSGSTHNLSSGICLVGWCVLSELVLNCVFLPMSSWWESCWCLSGLSSASANVFLVSSVDVFHEVSPNVFCQICLQEPLDVFQDQPTVFLPVSV